MMILDDTSLLTTGSTACDMKADEGSATQSKPTDNNKTMDNANHLQTTTTTTTTTINAINSNTFVVKLKGSGNGDTNLSTRTNLLQLFSENRSSTNVSVVKALGIGRIVVNRTLLKNTSKHKSPLLFHQNARTSVLSTQSAATPITVKIPSDTIKLGPSRNSIFIRGRPQNTLNGKENETFNCDKKDDDIRGNLANFMNFKLSSIVPSPIKSELGMVKTFKVSMNPIDVVLPRAGSKAHGKDSSLPQSPRSQNEETQSNLPESSDNDLTSLSWLTTIDKTLLKTIRSCNPDDAGISLSGDETDEEEDDYEYNGNKAVFTAKSKVDCSGQGGFAARQYGQSYNHNGKPPYSFSCLIFMAVEDSFEKKLPVKEIYSWVCKHFPYFQTAPSGWKNSIRHNLSLNKCFKKADQGKHSHDAVKGSLWCIDPAYRPNLIQALKRTPFYPYLYPSGIGQPLSLNNLASLLPGAKSGRIPSWSPNMFLPRSQLTDPDVASAALNLLGLRGNDAIDNQSPSVKSTLQELAAEIFNQNSDTAGTIPLIITDPAEDHTYSMMSFVRPRSTRSIMEAADRCTSPDSDKSAPDAAYEFETCGTDLESDADLEEGGMSECELGDSGFASLRGSRKRKNVNQTPEKAQAKRRKKSTEQKSEKALKRSSNRAKVTPRKGKLKVRFQPKKKVNQSKKEIARKTNLSKSDDGMSSDVDSGKDSPKVECKSRSRTRGKTRLVETISRKREKKTIIPTAASPNHTSPYGTRSRSQTRHSKRIAASDHGNILERASARKRRQDSISVDWEEEEIKLAAGSLLHLAGFRSPPSSSQTNP